MKCFVDDCETPPVYRFLWPWENGQGFTCTQHQPQLQTQAEQLGRAVQIVPLPVPGDDVIAAQTIEIEKLKQEGVELRHMLDESELRKEELHGDIMRQRTEVTNARAELATANAEIASLKETVERQRTELFTANTLLDAAANANKVE